MGSIVPPPGSAAELWARLGRAAYISGEARVNVVVEVTFLPGAGAEGG